jgi:hypothetical protein
MPHNGKDFAYTEPRDGIRGRDLPVTDAANLDPIPASPCHNPAFELPIGQRLNRSPAGRNALPGSPGYQSGFDLVESLCIAAGNLNGCLIIVIALNDHPVDWKRNVQLCNGLSEPPKHEDPYRNENAIT